MENGYTHRTGAHKTTTNKHHNSQHTKNNAHPPQNLCVVPERYSLSSRTAAAVRTGFSTKLGGKLNANAKLVEGGSERPESSFQYRIRQPLELAHAHTHTHTHMMAEWRARTHTTIRKFNDLFARARTHTHTRTNERTTVATVEEKCAINAPSARACVCVCAAVCLWIC